MTRKEFFDKKRKGALWDVGVSIKRGNPLPIDADSVFESKAKADEYVAGVLAYPGQIIAVVEESATTIYYIDQAMALQEVGKIPVGDNKSIKVAEDGTISIYGVDTAEIGAQPVKQADGTIKWIIPDTTTVEGLSKAIENLKGRIDPIEKTEYGIEKLAKSTDGMLATYQLYKTVDGGAKTYLETKIDIPKDLVVNSGSVVTFTDETAPTVDGKKLAAGTYIELVIANKTSDKLYIPVDGLIEYVTSGSADGDDIVITVSDDHKVTAALSSAIKTSLGKADTALQPDSIASGKGNGTIAVNGTDVAVRGLGDAAYTTVKSIEDKIATAKSEAIADAGTAADTKIATKVGKIGDKTVKAYTDDAVSAVESKVDDLTTSVGALDLKALAHLDVVDEAHLDETLATKINNKADKATTLAGYGITDAMTATAIGTAIEDAKEAAAADAQSKADAVSNALTPKITKLEKTHATKEGGEFKTVAEEVTTGIDALNLSGTYAAKSLEATVANHTADTNIHITADERTKWDKASTQSETNKTAIATLNDADTVEGSVDNKIKTAKTAIDSSIAGVKATAEAAKTAADANTAAIGTDATANTIKGRIKAAETAIDTLNGTSATTGSVAKAVADAQTALLDSASADYNTLGKLETKVKAAQSTADSAITAIGSDDTSGLRKRVKKNETDITGLGTRLTTAENDIDTLQGQISGVFHFKGSATKNGTNLYVTTPDGVAQVVNQVVGDVYTVGDEEWAWDGTSWIMLGITTDLSNYYNKSQIDGKIGGITGAFHFRGVATSFETDGTPAYVVQDGKKYVSGIELKEGDVWLDGEGQQFAWNGTEWIKLGYMTDLSAYSTTSQVESMIEGALTGLYTFKGEAGSLDNIVNPSRGDVYIVGGKQFAWSGNDWIEITTNVDLSSYSTTEQVNELINTAKSATLAVAASDATTKANTAYANALAKVNELKGDATKTVGAIEGEVNNLSTLVSDPNTGLDKRVTDNTAAIAAINNTDTGILKTAKDYTDEVSKRVTTLESLKPAEAGAQANKIESIAMGDGTNLAIESKKVTIPKATAAKLGLVKSSAAENKVSVDSTGVMEVNSLNINKLIQTPGDTLILDCGTSVR